MINRGLSVGSAPECVVLFCREARVVVLLLVVLLLAGCQRPMPRPVGYERMMFDSAQYDNYTPPDLPFEFAFERNAQLQRLPSEGGYSSLALVYPQWKAVVLCTYCRLSNKGLAAVAAESYELVFRHTVMANTIDCASIQKPDLKVYGNLYSLTGKVATPYQLELTDSVTHFFRASLTVNTTINPDSLAPLYDHLLADIHHLISTFRFK